MRTFTLREIRKLVGMTQQSLAERLRTRGRGAGFQGDVMKVERSYNSPTIARLKDYVESMGYTLEISVSREGFTYPLDVNPLAQSRTKDAHKEKSEESA